MDRSDLAALEILLEGQSGAAQNAVREDYPEMARLVDKYRAPTPLTGTPPALQKLALEIAEEIRDVGCLHIEWGEKTSEKVAAIITRKLAERGVEPRAQQACDSLCTTQHSWNCVHHPNRVATPEPPQPSRPRIICLCGSTRFVQTFQVQYDRLNDEGCIVLTVGRIVPRHDHTSERKKNLDELHLRKIDLCDEVLVLNVGGYIGQSTRNEIEYATRQGKPVSYLEPLAAPVEAAPQPEKEAK